MRPTRLSRPVLALVAVALTVASPPVNAASVHLRSLLSFDALIEDRAAVDDKTCVYKFLKLSCEPSDTCSFQFKLGDLTPSQSCRVKKTSVAKPLVGKSSVGTASVAQASSSVSTIPQQVHTAFAGATPGTAMTISWTTFTKLSDPAVWIGTSATALALSTAVPSIVTYYSDDKYSLFNYHATVSGLTPHTAYAFQVGSEAHAKDRSEVGSFTTARAVTDDDEFDIAIYGDLGVDANAEKTIEYINKNLPGKVDFVFHVGDISYADNAGVLTPSEAIGFFYEETFNAFMNLVGPVMSTLPYMVLVGNHEAECHSARCLISSSKKDQLGNYRAYNARFKMPSAESGGAKNMWYSFDHGPVHFTTISSETDYTGAPKNSFVGRKYGGFGDQMTWLEADLQEADANRANTPWLIVMMHRAIYTRTLCDADGVPTGEAVPVQKAFEDLFIKYKVDLVVSGHVHLYSRHFPIKKNVAVMDGVSEDLKTYTSPKAPVYVISGAAGNNEGHKEYDAEQNITWNAVMDNKNYGISKLHVSRTSLKWQFIGVATGALIDDFEITK